jgi:hypothetical protein
VLTERSFVFNIVWTPGVFAYLRSFVASQLHWSDARFRFLANGCRPEEVRAMEAFAERHPERVVEVLEVSSGRMLSHGAALDLAFAERHDGEHFCFVDPDILARDRFLPAFVGQLESGFDAVTSGRGVWADTDVVPPGHIGVNGEYFYSASGYLFGSPHFAMYRRDVLDETFDRWGVRLAMGGPDLPDAIRERLAEAGHTYWVYDTAKVTNILLQEDGHRLTHLEHPGLLHIGGISHYLSAPRTTSADGMSEPNWKSWPGMETRFEVAHFTAEVLRSLTEGRPPPPVPADLDADLRARLTDVSEELVRVVQAHGDA